MLVAETLVLVERRLPGRRSRGRCCGSAGWLSCRQRGRVGLAATIPGPGDPRADPRRPRLAAMASRTAVLDRVERLRARAADREGLPRAGARRAPPGAPVRRPRLAADRPGDPGGDLAAGRRARPRPARPAAPRPAALPDPRQPLDRPARRGTRRRDAARRDRRRPGAFAAVARVPVRASGSPTWRPWSVRDRFGCWAWLDLWRTGGAAYAPATRPSSPTSHPCSRAGCARPRRGRSSTTPRGWTSPGRP